MVHGQPIQDEISNEKKSINNHFGILVLPESKL